jgi:pimeloyl-ACP methyl ester carboxylesterase
VRHVRPIDRRGLGLSASVLVALALALVASACSSTPSATATSASSTSTSSTTSTTTTTTIPVPQTLAASAPTAGFGPLGSVSRLRVAVIAPGATLPGVGALDPVSLPGLARVAYRQFGSGPSLVLIAGEHATMTSWDPQFLLDLGAHYQVTVLDLPGVGYSTPIPDFTVAHVADLLAGFVVELGLTSPVVMGWGMGAEVALGLAERHVHLLGGLVLLEPTIGSTRTLAPTASVSALLASPDATDAELATLAFPPTAGPARATYLARVAEVPPDDIVSSAITTEARLVASSTAHSPVAAGLSEIALPTLVIVGTDDVVARPSNGVLLAQAIPKARLLRLPGAGYGSATQAEDAILKGLASFIPVVTASTTTTTTTSTTTTTTTSP